MATCVCCGSKKAKGQRKRERKLLPMTSFFMPLDSRKKVKSSYWVECDKCGFYEKLGVKTNLPMISAIPPKQVALQNFKDIFKGTPCLEDFSLVYSSITAIAKYVDDSYRVVFKMCDIKGYLHCRRTGQYWWIVAVEAIP